MGACAPWCEASLSALGSTVAGCAPGDNGLSGRGALAGDDECVVRGPAETDGLARAPELCPGGPLHVLLEHGQGGSPGCPDRVLGADAEVGGVGDGPAEHV